MTKNNDKIIRNIEKHKQPEIMRVRRYMEIHGEESMNVLDDLDYIKNPNHYIRVCSQNCVSGSHCARLCFN